MLGTAQLMRLVWHWQAALALNSLASRMEASVRVGDPKDTVTGKSHSRRLRTDSQQPNADDAIEAAPMSVPPTQPQAFLRR